jgi:hypothetical protein
VRTDSVAQGATLGGVFRRKTVSLWHWNGTKVFNYFEYKRIKKTMRYRMERLGIK